MSTLPAHGSGVLADDGRTVVLRGGNSLLMRVLGTPFLLIGVGLVVGLAHSEGSVPPPAIAIGGLFALVGTCFVFHVSRCVIDPLRQTLEVQRGVFMPLWRRNFPFDAIDRVELIAYRVSSGRGSRTQYGVRIEPAGSDFGQPVRGRGVMVWSAGSYPAARKIAERIAGLVRRPLADRTAGTVHVRQPDELDTPIAELWRREGVPQRPSAPPGEALRAEIGDGRVRIELPPAGMRGPAVVFVIALVATVSTPFFVLGFLFSDGAPPWVVALYAGFTLIPVFVVASLLAWFAWGRTELRADPSGVTIVQRLGPFVRSSRLGAEELEEVFVRSAPENAPALAKLIGNALILRSDARTVQTAWGRSEAELEWLVSAIRWALTRRG